MKKTALFLALLFLVTAIMGQSSETKVPLDDRIVTGTLDNGLTYYIMPNQKPENKIELRLVVNAGSVLESDAQQGLAHFCEHMAFNGTENFKKNELVDYLQTAGVKFGAHVNAYTSFDETVYMLSLPTEDHELVDKGFQILEDWAHNLLFDSLEIEKERGVVLEEYRLGLGAQKRMMASYLPKVLYQSMYAKRLPIGKKEVLENFKKEDLISFYRDWYRPDLMAIIVVGDIGVDEAKSQILSHFSSMTNPPDARKRFQVDVPDHKETFVTTVSDPEATYGTIQISYKIDGMYHRDGSEERYNQRIRQDLFYTMLNDRISDKSKNPESAFTTAWVYQGELWVRNKEAVQAFAFVGGGKYLEALSQLSTEIERAREHGFTPTELQRAKINRRTSLERALKEVDKTESRRYAGRLIRHFLTQAPNPHAQWSLQQYDALVENISVHDLNELLAQRIRVENRVVTITGPESESGQMPDEDQVLSALKDVQEGGTSTYEELLLPQTIMAIEPTPGAVTNSVLIKEHETHSLTLSNGVRVLVKPTTLKNDQILFSIQSQGGTNMLDDELYKSVKHGLGVISETGVGDYSDSDLEKILAGKSVRVSPFIGSTSEGMTGNCRPQDAESMMQLIHLYFTQPRLDPEAYQAFVNRQRSFYDNVDANPSSYFRLEWGKWRYNNHSRSFSLPKQDDWDLTQYPLVNEVYQQRFANAADFVFVFVGNIEMASFEHLLKMYIGSLPANDSREETKDVGYNYRPGTHTFTVKKGSEPKSLVQVLFNGKMEYNKHEDLALDMAAEILTIKLIEVLREEMGGVYGTSARNYFIRKPNSYYSFSISFPCGPENVDTLIAAALGELHKLITNGPEEKDLDKVKQTMIKTLKTDVQRNRFWLNQLVWYDYHGDELTTQQSMEEQIMQMTVTEIQRIANLRLTGDHLIGVLYPEE